MPVTPQNVDEVFTYHSPSQLDLERYAKIREGARVFARTILDNTPSCADQQAALRLLREAVMTANAGVALEGMV